MKKKAIMLSISLLLLVSSSIPLITSGESPLPHRQGNGTYSYIITVDNEGEAYIEIEYTTLKNEGTSWVLVPKNFTPWKYQVIEGEITEYSISDAYTSSGEKYVFYNNFSFNFAGSNGFKLTIAYDMNYGSIIVEPKGFFYSPQIGFSSQDEATIFVRFPKPVKLKKDKMAPKPETISEYDEYSEVIFKIESNLARIAIEYTTSKPLNETIIESEIFHIKTPTRYVNLAERLLSAYGKVYENMTKIFAVSLSDVNVKFFAPTLEDLWIAGFIPFNGTHLGEINLNLFFVRTAVGYWEQIAIHELVHQFVWAAGISPDILWFHEGLAEYISYELTLRAGWTGAESKREKLEALADTLKPNLGFIQKWRPGKQDENIIAYYAASYFIVKEIAKNNDGLEFYKRFFNKIKDIGNITSIDTLIHYLSSCAKTDLTSTFVKWGFTVVDVYIVQEAIRLGKKTIEEQLPIAQPWLFIAEKLLEQAENALRQGDLKTAIIKASIGETLAKTSLTLTIITIAAIILLALRRIRYEEELESRRNKNYRVKRYTDNKGRR